MKRTINRDKFEQKAGKLTVCDKVVDHLPAFRVPRGNDSPFNDLHVWHPLVIDI